jgi:hypothetical protein
VPVRVVASHAPSARCPDEEGAAVEVVVVRFGSSASSYFIVDYEFFDKDDVSSLPADPDDKADTEGVAKHLIETWQKDHQEHD